MEHAYLGPSFTNEECIAACEAHPEKPIFKRVTDGPKKAAELLASGNPLAWFQGRMEFGPRSLGCRSILGDPSYPGVADRINAQIKYRERWRPFCPSMLDTVAEDLLQTNHPAPYMTFTFDVNPAWNDRIPEVVHEDGTARAQVVTRETNPRYYALIKHLEKLRGNAVVLNTSLNRRGEPMICSPTDALNMFYGCDLEYLMMEDILVTKK
jgi:carbamoyltransferase